MYIQYRYNTIFLLGGECPLSRDKQLIIRLNDEEYSFLALNASINNKKHEEYDTQIKNKDQIQLLTSITDFEKISLYQYSEYKRNIINLSKDKQVIVFTAQYMGPEIDHTNYFDFGRHRIN